MQIAKLGREEFLTWVATGKIGQGVTLKKTPALSKGDVALIYEEAGYHASRSPLLLVKDEQELLDFYAFVSTYVSTYVPFSAFFRTLTVADFESARLGRVDFAKKLEKMLVGAIICSAISNDLKGDLAQLSLTECLTSESFALAQAVLAGLTVKPDRFYSRWQYCSSILNGDRSTLGSTESMSFWDVTFSAVGLTSRKIFGSDTDLVVSAVERLLSVSEGAVEAIWEDILKINPEITKIRRDMSGAREVRARAFTSVVGSEHLSNKGVAGDFIVGFLGSLLAGGAFEYAKLISGFKPIYPTSALWFGFISASMKDSDVLSAGSSLGRHILKQFGESGDLLGIPRCDISFGELALLARSSDKLEVIRGRSSDSLEIELFPSFVCAFKRGADKARVKSSSFAGISKDALAEANQLLSKLQRVLSQESFGTRDRDLFDSPSSRKKPR